MKRRNAKMERYRRQCVRQYNAMMAGNIVDYLAEKKQRQYDKTMRLLKERLAARRARSEDETTLSTADAVPLPLKEEVGAAPNDSSTAIQAKAKEDKPDERL